MNRQDELKELMSSAEKMPGTWDMNRTKKSVKRKAFIHGVAGTVRNSVLTLCLCMIVICVGVNTSEAFAQGLENVPVINKVAKFFNFYNKGYEKSVEAEYYEEQNLNVTGKKINMDVSITMADDSTLVMIYKINEEKSNCEYAVEIKEMKDADTGEVIEAPYGISTDGENDCLEVYWDKFVQNLDLTLSVSRVTGEFQTEYLEDVKVSLYCGEKEECRVYNADFTFEVNEMQYRIGEVRMYPLSTEIDVWPLSERSGDYEGCTLDMKFKLTDGTTAIESGTFTTSNVDLEKRTFILESGYFSLKGDHITLSVTDVYQRPKNRKFVYLDVENKRFFDDLGEDENLKFVDEKSDEYLIVHFVTDDENLSYMRYNMPFNLYDVDFEVQDEIIDTDYYGKDYVIIKKNLLPRDENGYVKFLRNYPTDVFRFDDLSVELK